MLEEISAPEALDRELEEHHLEGHWNLPAGALRPVPEPIAQAYRWPWAVIRRLLLAAGSAHDIEGGASRRTVRLCTPGMPTKWTTPTIHTSVQLVKPGEIAAAHRHSMGAFRFVIEGTGGWTTVEGEKLRMAPADLVLTPAGTWHDHGHEGSEPMMWIDGHDFPFVDHLNGISFETFSKRQQDVLFDDDHTRSRTGAVRPIGLRSSAAGIPYLYRGKESVALLRSLGRDDYDPLSGITLDYVNPLTGGSVLPTTHCRLHLLPAGDQTQHHRRSCNLIFHVVEGSGTTETEHGVLEWTTGDIFVVPNWTRHHHRAGGTADAVLFGVSDEPIFKAFDLFRCEE